MKILKRLGFCLLLPFALLPAVAYAASADTNTAPLPTASLLSAPATTANDAEQGYTFDEETSTLTITSQEGMNYWASLRLSEISSVQHLVIQGNDINIPVSAFSEAPNLESVKTSGSDISVGSFAFSSCEKLTSVELSGVSSIGSSAFSFCGKLDSVELSGVSSIGSSAFSYCTNLATVQILDGVTSIGSFAFSSCLSIVSLEIPGTVESIDDYAFVLCSDLQAVVFTGTKAPEVGEMAFYNGMPTVLVPQGFSSSSGKFGDLSMAEYTLDENGTLTITANAGGGTVYYPESIGGVTVTAAQMATGVSGSLAPAEPLEEGDLEIVSWEYVDKPELLDENNTITMDSLTPISYSEMVLNNQPGQIVATTKSEKTKTLSLFWVQEPVNNPYPPSPDYDDFGKSFTYVASVTGYTFVGTSAPTITYKPVITKVELQQLADVSVTLEGAVTKEEFLEKLPSTITLTETESGDTHVIPVTWSCTSSSFNNNATVRDGTYTFEATATDKKLDLAKVLGQKPSLKVTAQQTMIELQVSNSSTGNGTWAPAATNTLAANDEGDSILTWTDKSTNKEYQVTIKGYNGDWNNGYIYIDPDKAEKVTCTSGDDAGKSIYRLELTISGENAENSEPMLSRIYNAYRYIEDYKNQTETKNVLPESYLIDAKPGEATFALMVVVNDNGKIMLNLSDGFFFHPTVTEGSGILSFDGEVSDDRNYQMALVNNSTDDSYNRFGKKFFTVIPPDNDHAYAVMLIPTYRLNNWNQNPGVSIDTSWERAVYVYFNYGWRFFTDSLFVNSAGNFAATYLYNNATAVVTELTLSPFVDNPTSVGLKGHATLSVDADYQYKGISSDLKVYYQWYKCTDENRSGAEAIPGATSSTYTPSTEQAGTYYYFVKAGFDEFTEVNGYKDSAGNILQDYDPYGWASETETTSDVMTLTVGEQSDIEVENPDNEPWDGTFTYGDSVVFLHLTVNIDGKFDENKTGTVTIERVNDDGTKTELYKEDSVITGQQWSVNYETLKKGLRVGKNKIIITFDGNDEEVVSSSTELTVTLKPKNVTAIVTNQPLTKIYDGNTEITLNFGFDAGDLEDGDTLTGTVKGRFDNASVGTGKTITLDSDSVEWSDATTAEYYDITLPQELTGAITAESTALTLFADPASLTGGGTVTLSLSGLPAGETATLSCDDGSISVPSEPGNTWTVTLPNETKTYTFTATYAGGGNYAGATATCQVNVTHQSTGSGGGSSSGALPPKVEEGDNGDVTVSPSRPQEGQTVTITPQPDEGYVIDEITVIDGDGNPVNVTDNGDGSYSFVQPDSRVTITVTFRPYDPVLDCPQDDSCPLANYEDLDPLAWYHAGVHYCLDHGLMVGMTDTLFEPQGTTTRAQVVTILWRLENAPEASSAAKFDDVADDAWYAGAVRWAASEGIVGGFGDGTFAPDAPVTREQLASMLNRYAAWKGEDVSARGDLSAFTDVDSESWSAEVLAWAKAEGLLGGISATTLEPTGNATRAQIATVIMRFCEQFLSE